MKKIPIITLLSLFLLATVSNVCSQEQQMTASTRAAKLTDWMKTNLKLNDSQVKQVEVINLKYANKTDELKASTTLTKDQKMEALKSDDAARDGELQKVFTEDQFKTYQAKKKEVKKMTKEKMKSKG